MFQKIYTCIIGDVCTFLLQLRFLSRNKRLYRFNCGNKTRNLIESLNRKVNKVNMKGHYQANDL